MTERLALAQNAYDLDALVKLLECDSMDRAYILSLARNLHCKAKRKLDADTARMGQPAPMFRSVRAPQFQEAAE